MGSLGDELLKKKEKAMWLYPKMMGASPPERWGHSSCYSDGFVYIFGGCCGGLHFSDVVALNLETMAWNTLATKGKGPGPRDSHTAVLFGHKMMVFGGTNGSKKVNDLHMLDLVTREWTQPNCSGFPPPPRESHTATLVGDSKLVVFGGSGEGEANYLNDLHVLDLKNMRWSSLEAKGSSRPVPRDSHSAVAIGKKLFVYGGDCGDRYQGHVDVFDMDRLIWSKMAVHGPSPGFRAGHAAVNFGTKVYVIGGVGEKQYYNDVWVLDIITCSWTRLEICGQIPRGRFSHTAVANESSAIVVYGGCGEDERPLSELLMLQLEGEHSNGCHSISMCKVLGSHCRPEKRKVTGEPESNSDSSYPKRMRMGNPRTAVGVESEPEEHSLSLSQNSSPSQSDQEQTPAIKPTNSSATTSKFFPLFKEQNQISRNCQSNNVPGSQMNPRTIIPRASQNFHLSSDNLNQPTPGPYFRVACRGRDEFQYPAAERRISEAGHVQNIIGAEIHGKVDGAFDSGYLMTATVNGKIFRGVLFAPGPAADSREAVLCQHHPSLAHQVPVNKPRPGLDSISPNSARQQHRPVTISPGQESDQSFRPFSAISSSPPALVGGPNVGNELQGVVLTLGGPATGHSGRG